jgi:hypothetical protein
MRYQPESFTDFEIKKAFEDGTVNEEELIAQGLITPNSLKLILNPPTEWQKNFQELQKGWDTLRPMKDNRTDIYFFGIPSSGKSCLLGGLLYYLQKNGRASFDPDNDLGRKYADLLVRAMQFGYVPGSTNDTGANYIAATFRSEDNRKHDVNLVEMSGEFFKNTYHESSAMGGRNIGANNYLRNNNRKSIFLIVDYYVGAKNREAIHETTQEQMLDYVLTLLDRDGTLNATDALFLVITKADLLPNGVDDLASAEAFINDKFLNLRNNIRDYQKKYGFQTKILTFSLGRFMLGKTFEYNERSSKNMYDIIVATSFYNKGKGGWGRLFK